MFHYKNDDDARPLTKTELIITAVISLIMGVLFLVLIFKDFQPAKLSMLFFILFWVILLFVHELGHAVMAYILGWKVEKIVFGFGRIVSSFNFKKVQIEIRMFPIEGFTRLKPRNLKKVQIKDALIYFAGPGIEILAALILFLMLGSHTILTRSEDYLIIFYQTFIVTSLLGAVINLIPQSIFTQDGEIPNDGLGILAALSATPGDYEKAYMTEEEKP